MYYDYNKVLSFNAFLNFLHGERGVGKTYGAKKYVIKRFLKTGEQFIYLRRFKSDLKKSIGTFYSSLLKNNEFENHNFYTKGNEIYIDDKIAGYGISLTIAQSLKSSEFPNVKTIIFDEYLIEKGQQHYLRDEVNAFLGLIETVARMRDVRVLLLGNSTSVINPYFLYFNLDVPKNSDIKVFKDGLILVQYMKNEEYRQKKKETRFGKLIEGTDFGDYAIENKFLEDSNEFISKKSENSKFLYSIRYRENIIGIWYDYKEQLIFATDNYDKSNPFIYCFRKEDHREGTIFIINKKTEKINLLIKLYEIGNLKFKNQKIKGLIMEILKLYIGI